MSGDASTIVGYLNNSVLANQRAAFWSVPAGHASVPGFVAGFQSYATGANFDGSVIVGDYGTGVGTSGGAFRYAAGDVLDLGTLPGTENAVPVSVSAGGDVIAGYANSSNGERAFRWTASTGMVNLGLPTGTIRSIPTTMSSDGAAVVGSAASGGPFAPFRWTMQAGYQMLTPIPSNEDIWPSATNANGSAIVMEGFPSASRSNVLLWTQAGGMHTLPNPSGFLRWDPIDMSADGLSVVGQASLGNTSRGVIWRPELGTVLLSTYLQARGLNLMGWMPEDAQAISDDGNTFLCGCSRTGPSGFERAELLLTVPSGPALVPLGLWCVLAARRPRRSA